MYENIVKFLMQFQYLSEILMVNQYFTTDIFLQQYM